jgi:hypothetical protein
VHSKYSFDSNLGLELILKVAKKRRLSGVAITDHNVLTTHLPKDRDIFMIRGCEIMTDRGEILALFITERITSRDFYEVTDEVRAQGGIAAFSHPFDPNRSVLQIDRQMLSSVDAIEGFNARNTHDQYNIQAQFFARKHRIPMVAGSDAHFSWEIGRGRLVLDDVSDIESIRKAILQRKAKIIGARSPRIVHLLSALVAFVKKAAPASFATIE